MQTSLTSKRKQNKQQNSSYRIHLYVFRSRYGEIRVMEVRVTEK